jgi:hypothetical protein
MAFDVEHGVFVVVEDYDEALVVVFDRGEARVVTLFESSDAHVEGGGFYAPGSEESPVAVGYRFD